MPAEPEFVHTLLTATQDDMDAAMRAIALAGVTGIVGLRAQLPAEIMRKATIAERLRIATLLRTLDREHSDHLPSCHCTDPTELATRILAGD